MQIELFEKRLEKLSANSPGFEYLPGSKVTKADISITENKLGVKFPDKLITFYEYLNGLQTTNPTFKIIAVEHLILDKGQIHFATFDNQVAVCLRTDTLNEANEWTIINRNTEFEITKSISSFWSNKIWHWLEKGNLIWEENWWE